MKIMKLKYIAICALMSGSFTACDLDVTPPGDLGAETFWQTEKDAWYALNTCYANLPGLDIFDEMTTDNAHSQKSWEGPWELTQTNGISSGDAPNDYSFGQTRIVNMFLENVDRCDMDDDLRERMKAEARFFRAFEYLNTTCKHGKAPIITTVVAYDAPNVERNPVEEVQAFILKELEEIADILPDSYPGGELYETGRITRAAALALRARAALYFGNFSEAEKSAGLVISEGNHELFRISGLNAAQQKESGEMDQYIDFDGKGVDKDKFMKGLFSYEALWHGENANPSNPEYILTTEFMADDGKYDWQRYIYIRPSQLVQGYSSYAPMQDLVDAYWSVDGKTVPTPPTVEERKNNYVEIWNDFNMDSQQEYIAAVAQADISGYPYMSEFRNRDSRLYASILFPFKGWHETDFGTFYYRWNPEWVGIDSNESWTGYSYRKMVALTSYNDYDGQDDYPLIRYAEVLLTYAEARIQTTGWDDKVQEALNDIRDRCGMPDVPVSMASKDAALEFVRNERRIELAGEGHRYEDIRRYGSDYCKKVMTGKTYAPCGQFDPKKEIYTDYVVVEKQWGDRLMLMPIPQAAIMVNPLLGEDQNPGY